MNTRLDYLWEKVSLFTQFSDLAKIFEPIFFKISLKTGPIFDHPLLVKIGSEIRKSVQNRKTDIFSSPGLYELQCEKMYLQSCPVKTMMSLHIQSKQSLPSS